MFRANKADELEAKLKKAEEDLKLEEFYSGFMRKLWWLEMVHFIEVLEDIGCFGFWDVSVLVTVNLEWFWH